MEGKPQSQPPSPIHVFIDLANATAQAKNAVIAKLDLTKHDDIGRLAVYLYSIEKYVYSLRPESEAAQRNRPILFYIVLGRLAPMAPEKILNNLDSQIGPVGRSFISKSDLLNILSRVQIWWPGELRGQPLPWAASPCPPGQRQTNPDNQAEHTCGSPDDLLLLWLIGQSPNYEDVYIISEDKFRSEGEFIGCIAADIDTEVTLDKLANKCGGYLVLPHRLLPTTPTKDLMKGVTSVSYQWFAADEAVLHREILPKKSFKKFLQYVIPNESSGGARPVWYMSPPITATTAVARHAKLDLGAINSIWKIDGIKGTEGRRYYRPKSNKGKGIHIILNAEPIGEKLDHAGFKKLLRGRADLAAAWASSFPVRDDFTQVPIDYFLAEMFEMVTRCRDGPAVAGDAAFGKVEGGEAVETEDVGGSGGPDGSYEFRGEDSGGEVEGVLESWEDWVDAAAEPAAETTAEPSAEPVAKPAAEPVTVDEAARLAAARQEMMMKAMSQDRANKPGKKGKAKKSNQKDNKNKGSAKKGSEKKDREKKGGGRTLRAIRRKEKNKSRKKTRKAKRKTKKKTKKK